MKIQVINGPNLNMLGIREPDLYGKSTYAELVAFLQECGAEYGVEVSEFQSNVEGDLVTCIQKCYQQADAIVINAAAYTHTSIALLDALKAVGLPAVEVHLTDLSKRDAFRRVSYVGMACEKTVMGKGFEGYREAIAYLANKDLTSKK